MKYCLLFVFSSLFVLCATGQDSTVRLSQFELFCSQPGKIIKTESKELGYVAGVAIGRIKATDITSAKELSAIKIYTDGVGVGAVDHRLVYIDLENVDSIISVLTYFLEESKHPKPTHDKYYVYVTASDVEVSCFYRTSGFGFWNFNIKRIYPKLRTPVPGSSYSFGRGRVTDLIDLLKQAKGTVI